MFDPIYIPVVAFCGSACGSIATILSNWVTQRRQDRVRNKSRASSRRAKLYKAFIEEAEKAGHVIIQTYLAPNRTFADLADLIKEMDPLRDFSEACRRELQAAQWR